MIEPPYKLRRGDLIELSNFSYKTVYEGNLCIYIGLNKSRLSHKIYNMKRKKFCHFNIKFIKKVQC